MSDDFKIDPFRIDSASITAMKNTKKIMKRRRRESIPATSEKNAIIARIKTTMNSFAVAKELVGEQIESITIPISRAPAFTTIYSLERMLFVSDLIEMAAGHGLESKLMQWLDQEYPITMKIGRYEVRFKLHKDESFIFESRTNKQYEVRANCFDDVAHIVDKESINVVALLAYFYHRDVLAWVTVSRMHGQRVTRLLKAFPNRELIDSINDRMYPLHYAYAQIMAENETAQPTYTQIAELAHELFSETKDDSK